MIITWHTAYLELLPGLSWFPPSAFVRFYYTCGHISKGWKSNPQGKHGCLWQVKNFNEEGSWGAGAHDWRQLGIEAQCWARLGRAGGTGERRTANDKLMRSERVGRSLKQKSRPRWDQQGGTQIKQAENGKQKHNYKQIRSQILIAVKLKKTSRLTKTRLTTMKFGRFFCLYKSNWQVRVQ